VASEVIIVSGVSVDDSMKPPIEIGNRSKKVNLKYGLFDAERIVTEASAY
jgi:hypothetical protein